MMNVWVLIYVIYVFDRIDSFWVIIIMYICIMICNI